MYFSTTLHISQNLFVFALHYLDLLKEQERDCLKALTNKFSERSRIIVEKNKRNKK